MWCPQTTGGRTQSSAGESNSPVVERLNKGLTAVWSPTTAGAARVGCAKGVGSRGYRGVRGAPAGVGPRRGGREGCAAPPNPLASPLVVFSVVADVKGAVADITGAVADVTGAVADVIGAAAGVRQMLSILRGELTTAMALTGCASLADVRRSLVQLPHEPPPRDPLHTQLPRRPHARM
eukprot:1134435-Prorocentrum_minimum.AAC.1